MDRQFFGFRTCLLFDPFVKIGGDSALFPNNVSLDIIMGFGRWKSSEFHIYLYGGSLNLRDVSPEVRKEENLMDQIRVANDNRIHEKRVDGKTDPAKFRHRVAGRGDQCDRSASGWPEDLTSLTSDDYENSAESPVYAAATEQSPLSAMPFSELGTGLTLRDRSPSDWSSCASYSTGKLPRERWGAKEVPISAEQELGVFDGRSVERG